MKEHVNHKDVIYDPHRIDPFVVISWKEQWYKLPFFVLDTLLSEMINEKRSGTKQLSNFLNSWKSYWTEVPIKILKDAIEKEMPGMEAYILYDTA